jgi:hypothetical protein
MLYMCGRNAGRVKPREQVRIHFKQRFTSLIEQYLPHIVQTSDIPGNEDFL